jgi:hypothetical protein
MRLPALYGNYHLLHVKNCESLLVPANSLSDLDQLTGIKFENIEKLDFHEFSFNQSRTRPSIRFEISNSTVPTLPSHFIKGNLHEMILTDSIVQKIHIFALTGFFSEINTFRINNTLIEEVESQAFKKLTIRNLEIINSEFRMNLMSNTFYDCHVQNFVIDSSSFTLLYPSTFDVKEVQRLTISNTTFGVIEGEAFMIDVSDRAIFSNNNISMLHHSAFRGEEMSFNDSVSIDCRVSIIQASSETLKLRRRELRKFILSSTTTTWTLCTRKAT